MEIGGIQKTSVLDYQDKLCAIIWTSGCNLRCPFCYNVDLVFKKITDFIKERIGSIKC